MSPKILKVKYLSEDRGYSTPCWIWQGSTRGGYGMISNYGNTGSKMIGAHTFYYEQKYGKVPSGMVLDHLCDQRICVNPEHLKLCTHEENIRRGKIPIIDENIAEEIRVAIANGDRQCDIALKYGISQPTVSQIKRGITWR